jgi:biotin synthase
MELNLESIESWLRTDDGDALQVLWKQADEARSRNVGAQIHLRGLIEISNYCVRRCGYCGLNVSNRKITRYRMTGEEIVDCALLGLKLGYGTVVLQAGEDYGISREFVCGVVRRIKGETPLAVTLSLGERPLEDLKAWRSAGADRYLLRFETSDPELYRRIHPPLPKRESDRMTMLRDILDLGYEAGSGVMIGIPGQTYSSLAQDINLFRQMDLDMIGVGPYIPHPETDLVTISSTSSNSHEQVPNSELMTYKVIALARLVCPTANIPSTTALATINKVNGRELGLKRGANVLMPNLTPPQYRVCYEIYPDKACIQETADLCHSCLGMRIATIGRIVGHGPGNRHSRGQTQAILLES